MVSLSLFKTLLSLNCEDLMLQLVLRCVFAWDKRNYPRPSWTLNVLRYAVCALSCSFMCRYLLPCTHVMLSQRRAVRETDLYGKSADKFLSLIPECCRITTAASSEREEEPAFWGKGEYNQSWAYTRLFSNIFLENSKVLRYICKWDFFFFFLQLFFSQCVFCWQTILKLTGM